MTDIFAGVARAPVCPMTVIIEGQREMPHYWCINVAHRSSICGYGSGGTFVSEPNTIQAGSTSDTIVSNASLISTAFDPIGLQSSFGASESLSSAIAASIVQPSQPLNDPLISTTPRGTHSGGPKVQ